VALPDRNAGGGVRSAGVALELVSKNIYDEGISFIADRFHDRDEHTRHPRDQSGQRRDTCQIVSTAGARQHDCRTPNDATRG